MFNKTTNKFLKIVSATALTFGLVSSAHAEKIGVGFAADMGIGFAAQFDDKINISLGNAGVASDYIFKTTKIDADFNTEVIEKISWYAAGGIGYYWADWNGKEGDVDLRVPLGVDVDFAKVFDGFIQVAPTLRMGDNPKFGITGAFGVRYYY